MVPLAVHSVLFSFLSAPLHLKCTSLSSGVKQQIQDRYCVECGFIADTEGDPEVANMQFPAFSMP